MERRKLGNIILAGGRRQELAEMKGRTRRERRKKEEEEREKEVEGEK